MIAVIFEVLPHPTRRADYLNLAAGLRPVLEQLPGFLSIERFESLSQPGKLLSLSFWENEDSVHDWRNVELHREAQAHGRAHVFADYRLRVAHVLRDYGMFERTEAPADSQQELESLG